MRHQFHGIDLKTFVLVRLWLRLNTSGKRKIPVRLWRITLTHWRVIVADPNGRRIREAMHAIRFFHKRPKHAIGDAEVGYGNTWKIQVLLYILALPKERYQVAELKASLLPGIRAIDRRLIRRFCQRNGIRRDVSAGERAGSRKHAFKRRYN